MPSWAVYKYDATQQRGEVAANGQRGKAVPDGNSLATVSDLGLTRKAIHEARQLRDAEAADPGVIRRTLDARLQQGQEATKAAMREARVNQPCAWTPRNLSASAITVLLL